MGLSFEVAELVVCLVERGREKWLAVEAIELISEELSEGIRRNEEDLGVGLVRKETWWW